MFPHSIVKKTPPSRAWIYAALALLFGVLAALSPIATPFVWVAAGLLTVLGLIGLRFAGFPRRKKTRKPARPKARAPQAAARTRRKQQSGTPKRPARRPG